MDSKAAPDAEGHGVSLSASGSPPPSRSGRAPRQAARQAALRTHNLALALERVAAPENYLASFESQPSAPEPPGVSRAEIADITGLTRATVSALVEQLLALRLLEWAPAGAISGVGRPAAPVRLARGTWAGLGLEVGANHLGAAVVDIAGQRLAFQQVRGDFAAPPAQQTLAALARLGARTWEQARRAHPGLERLGTTLAVPGIVREGVVLDAPRLGWVDAAAAQSLDEALEPLGPAALPGVAVLNEASLAALAESHARGPQTFLYASGGVGVGGAYVVAGAVQGGVHGFASELGHVTVDPAGPACRCGASGCLEQYVGTEALARLDPEAAGRALGIALAGAVNLLDVGRVVLGGSLGQLLPALGPALAAELASRVLAYPWAPVSVESALVTDFPGLRGAALSPVLRVLADPELLTAHG